MTQPNPTVGHRPASEDAQARGGIHRLAGIAHQAIDRLEHSLDSRRKSVGALPDRGAQEGHSPGGPLSHYAGQVREYGQRARDYGRQTRERVQTHPLQSAVIAFAAGALYSKLMYKTQVHVLKVPVPVVPPEFGASLHAQRERAQHLMHTAGGTLQRAGHAVVSKSHAYGSVAREQIHEHPLAGLAGALGLGAVASALLLGGERADPTRPAFLRRAGVEGPYRADRSISHPVASAALILAAGALLGALVRPR